MKEYELQYRRDERVMRYLTILMDKHAIAYSEKRRNLRKEKEAAAPVAVEEAPEAPAAETVNVNE